MRGRTRRGLSGRRRLSGERGWGFHRQLCVRARRGLSERKELSGERGGGVHRGTQTQSGRERQS